MLLSVFLIIIGFIFLIASADLLVDGSSGIAKKFHIPEIIIGLTIVSIGTSMPELFVSITSALEGHSDMSLGNIIGSNLSNLLLILGLSAIIKHVVFQKETRLYEIPMCLLFTITFMIFCNTNDGISRIEGIVNRIFDAVESNTGAMQILEDIKNAVNFFKKVSTPIGNISTRAYNNFINAVLDPIEKEKLDEEATREFNIESKDFNLRAMEIIDKVSSALREYLDGYITVKSKALLNIFKIIRNTVNVLGKNTIVLNNFFNNILAETTSIITGEPVDSGTEELRTRYAYNNLSDQVKSWLNNRGTNIDAYNRLSPQQQESYIRCMI